MYTAIVHTNSGEHFNLLRSDGYLGGKALLAFLQALEQYHTDAIQTKTAKTNDDEKVLQWFSTLEAKFKGSVYLLTLPLIESHYIGEYTYNEYAILSEKGYSPEKRQKWEQMFMELREKWKNIEPVFTAIKTLLDLLTEANLQATWWYEPSDTLLDFQALLETLTLAKERKAEQIIIQLA